MTHHNSTLAQAVLGQAPTLRFNTSGRGYEYGGEDPAEPASFISSWVTDIYIETNELGIPDETRPYVKIGRLEYQEVALHAAISAGQDLLAIDGLLYETPELYGLWPIVKTSKWVTATGTRFGSERTLIHIEKLKLKKKWRGIGLGARALFEFLALQRFKGAAVSVVAYPLNTSEDSDLEQVTAAAQKISECYQGIGFKAINGYYVMAALTSQLKAPAAHPGAARLGRDS